MAELPPGDDVSDNKLRRLKEFLAGSIAVPIVIVFLVILSVAFAHQQGDFTHVKDLLGLLSPFVGIVLGYYFNKERAESAEKNVRSAQESANKATDATSTVANVAKTAQEERTQIATRAQALQGSLNELVQVTDQLLPEASRAGGGVLSESTPAVQDTHAELRAALARARNLLK